MDRKTLTRAAVFVLPFLALLSLVLIIMSKNSGADVSAYPETGISAQETEAPNGSEGETNAETDVITPEETGLETRASISTSAETSAKASETHPPQTDPDDVGSLPVPAIITIDEANFSMTLVNRKYRIPDDYRASLSPCIPGSDVELDYRVAPYYEAMYNAAKADGCTLTPYSGYRRYSTQKANYERKIQYYRDLGYSENEAETLAAKIIMPPGSSEHNLGLAMDICGTDYSFDESTEFRWLMENAADYGFILRYAEEKQAVTQVVYEPWHWRFVGVENAKAIKESGLCLEEWLGQTAE